MRNLFPLLVLYESLLTIIGHYCGLPKVDTKSVRLFVIKGVSPDDAVDGAEESAEEGSFAGVVVLANPYGEAFTKSNA